MNTNNMFTIFAQEPIPDETFNDDELVRYNNMIKSSTPTDIIEVDIHLTNRLAELAGIKLTDPTPADIVFGKTIPIPDMLIKTIVRKDEISDAPDGLLDAIMPSEVDSYYTRIMLFDDWKERVDAFVNEMRHFEPDESLSPDEKIAPTEPIGLIILYNENDLKLYTTFGLFGTDELTPTDNRVGYFPANKRNRHMVGGMQYAGITTSLSLSDMLVDSFQQTIQLWYTIQIALLHPVIKKVFANGSKHPLVQKPSKPNKKGKKTTPKIKYVKKHIIKYSDFDDFFEEATEYESGYTRKALVWYVTGHWRNQKTKDGHKRIFIDGHWKGALRNTKMSDTREREIIT